MKREKGFTLVELIIVIVIVGILSIIAVPIYRGYVEKAVVAEGQTLLSSMQTVSKVYYSQFGNYDYNLSGDQTNLDEIAGVDFSAVDARPNKYFTTFSVTGSGDNLSVVTAGTDRAAGITLTLTIDEGEGVNNIVRS